MSDAEIPAPDDAELIRRIELATYAARLSLEHGTSRLYDISIKDPAVIWRMFNLSCTVTAYLAEKYEISGEDMRALFRDMEITERSKGE